MKKGSVAIRKISIRLALIRLLKAKSGHLEWELVEWGRGRISLAASGLENSEKHDCFRGEERSIVSALLAE